MRRTLVIASHTFREAVAQPVYLLVLALGAAVCLVLGFLPFFTIGEDTKMYVDVCRDTILLLVLLATLFATSSTIYDEIESRTMLTLMSKPVGRLSVLGGKYLGVVAAALLAFVALGGVLAVSTYLRVPGDYALNPDTTDDRQYRQIVDTRLMHLAGIGVEMLLGWMQVAVLAAVSVAVSTRLSLVVNLPLMVLLYVAGNLTRFVSVAAEGGGVVGRSLAWVLETALPFLGVFDLRSLTIHRPIGLPGTRFAGDPLATPVSTLVAEVSLAGLYAGLFVAAALAAGLILFRGRELGGDA